nr:PREDICTED: pleckstrin homology domain-containing family B member 2-like [Phalacrocorax carbo]
MAFVKSGWLLRQSTILRRWKKNWFDLWSDGRLIFYDDQNRHDIEDKIHMRIHCINLRVGNECRDFQPPEGKQRECLLQIVCRDGKTVNLCAESADDCLAWKIALQDARTNTVSVLPRPYTDREAAQQCCVVQQFSSEIMFHPSLLKKNRVMSMTVEVGGGAKNDPLDHKHVILAAKSGQIHAG